jgi:hypothetical protein
MFGMLSVLAELQRELIVASTRDGLAAARARGRNGGRRRKLDAKQVAQQRQAPHLPDTACDVTGADPQRLRPSTCTVDL